MEEDISIRLQTEVNRIVYPIRAGYDTKLKMQEELYAHLCGLFETERPNADDDNAAIRAALARLGELAELRRRLQGSVSWIESLNWYFNWEFLPSFTPVGRRKPDESDARRAARVASVQTALCVGVYTIIACAVVFETIPGVAVAVTHPVLGAIWIGAVNWVIFFAMHLLGPIFIDLGAEIGRRNLRWYVLTLAGGLFMLCCGFGVMASIAVVFDGSWHYRFGCLGGVFIVGSVFAGRLLGCQFFGHRNEEWLSLSR